MSTINGSVHSIQEFYVRQKVKFNTVLIEYHGDSGMNSKFPVQNVQTHVFKCDVIGCFWMLTNFALEGYQIQ